MAYKRSTQATGFKVRATPDVSKEINSQAKQMEANRVSAVKDMERQSKGQVVEMQRQDTLATARDKYELGNLSKFSKTLNKFLQASGEEVGKHMVATAQLEGVNLRRKVNAGDEEAIAKVELNEQQLAEIEKKIAKQKEITSKAGDEFDARAEEATLTQKYRALNLRKLGYNVAYGYTKASLGEARKGWQPWFLNQTKDNGEYSNDVLEFPVKEDGKENIIRIRVGDYEDLIDTDQKKAIENYLADKYVVNNSAGASPLVVDKYMTKGIYEDLAKYRVKQLGLEVKEQAQLEIKDRQHAVYSEVDGDIFDEDNTEGLDAALTDILVNGSSSQRRLQGTELPNVANKKDIMAVLENSFSIADPENGADLLEHLSEKKFTIPGLGTKTLEEHFPTLDLATLYASAKDKARINREKVKNAKLEELDGKITEAIVQRRNGGTQADFDTALAELNVPYFTSLNAQFEEKISNARDYKPEFLTEKAARNDAINIIEEHGEITLEQAQKYPPKIREEFEDKIVDKRIFSEGYVQDQFLKKITEVQGVLAKIYGTEKTNDIEGYSLGRAKEAVKSAIQKKAIELRSLPEYEGQNELQLLNTATSMINQEIQEGQTDPNSKWYVDPEGGFSHFKFQTHENTNLEPKLAQQRALFANAERQINSSTADILSTKKLTTEPEDLELLGTTNTPSKLIQQLASIDPQGRSSFEILNAQRKLHNLPPVTIPPEYKTLIDKVKLQPKEVLEDIRSGDPKRVTRALNSMGVTDLRTLHSSLVQEGITIIPENQIDSVLGEMGISRADYDSDESVRQKVGRYRVNQLMKLAAETTNNGSIMVRMVSTALTQGEENMHKWNLGAANESSFNVLNTYLTGDTSNITGTYSDLQMNAVLPNEKDGSILPNIFATKVPPTIEGIDKLDRALDLNKPNKYYSVDSGGKREYYYGKMGDLKTNPEWVKWNAKKQEVENTRLVVNSFNKIQNGRWYPDRKDLWAIKAILEQPLRENNRFYSLSLTRPLEQLQLSIRKELRETIPNWYKLSNKSRTTHEWNALKKKLQAMPQFGGTK